MDPPVNQPEGSAIPLHHISFSTGSIAHIDTKGRWTPLSIECSNSFFFIDVEQCIYIEQTDGPPQ